MGQLLWDHIRTFQNAQPFPPSIRAIARKAAIPESTLANWQHIHRMPEPQHLHAVATATGLPYPDLLTAALTDAGY